MNEGTANAGEGGGGGEGEVPSGGVEGTPGVRRRRVRYSGKYPRRFEEKYKERDPARYADTVERVLASGKTPAGMHRSILVREVLGVLALRPGDRVADCTLGYGGHSALMIPEVLPGGGVVGLDVDPIQLPRAEARLRGLGFGPEAFRAERSNFAGLPQVLGRVGWDGVDAVLADLGVSSMQIDDPTRGFSVKHEGPLDMRMNPERGESASAWLARVRSEVLVRVLRENADEPRAERLGAGLAGRRLSTTRELAQAVREAVPGLGAEEAEGCVRRVFQALRIVVNDEFSALDSLLRVLPGCLRAGGRVAILTFHSGEDRRVKRAFEAGLAGGLFAEISPDVIRPTPEERRANPRSSSAKLRWARRAR